MNISSDIFGILIRPECHIHRSPDLSVLFGVKIVYLRLEGWGLRWVL